MVLTTLSPLLHLKEVKKLVFDTVCLLLAPHTLTPLIHKMSVVGDPHDFVCRDIFIVTNVLKTFSN